MVNDASWKVLPLTWTNSKAASSYGGGQGWVLLSLLSSSRWRTVDTHILGQVRCVDRLIGGKRPENADYAIHDDLKSRPCTAVRQHGSQIGVSQDFLLRDKVRDYCDIRVLRYSRFCLL